MYKYFFKDIFDFYLAVILFIFFLPLMLLVYVVLYSLIGSPIYLQKRPGYMNKPFTIYKFKTLIDRKCKIKKKIKESLNLEFF